ncbi:MFS transporter [Marinomonas epiphytica]
MKQSNSLSPFAGLTLLCIASLTIMVGAVVAPGMLGMATALNVADSPALLITLPALGAILFAPLAGHLIDRFGSYRVLSIGLILYALLGVSLYFLNGAWMVFGNRILLGGVASAVMAGGSVLISLWYVGKARLGMIAKQGMAIEIGGVVFLFLGGHLASSHWGLPLLLYLLALLFLISLWLFVPSKAPQLSDQSVNASSTQIAFSLNKVFITALLSMLVFFCVIVLLPKTMAQQGFAESDTGNLLAFISLVAVIAAFFMPKLVTRLKEHKMLALAFVSYAICYGLIVIYGAQWLGLMVAGIFCGVGFGFSIPLLNHMTLEKSTEDDRGKNMSYFAMAVFSGQFLTSFVEWVPMLEHFAYTVLWGAAGFVAFFFLYDSKKSVHVSPAVNDAS